MNQRPLLWLVSALTPVLLTACRSPKLVEQTCTTSSNQETAALPLASSLDISVHVDGSGSMIGYVKPSDSNYIKALQILEDAVAVNTDTEQKVETSYFRSGSNRNDEITRSQFRAAQESRFYDNTSAEFRGVYSTIDTAVPSGDDPETEQVQASDQLAIIVTDLDQNQGDITLLYRKIQSLLNQKRQEGEDYAVGIWAVKSDFEGQVYVQNQQGIINNFTYSTQGKTPEQFRPFYVLFIGQYQDVHDYFDRIRSNLDNNDQLLEASKFNIFSPKHLVNSLAYLNVSPDSPSFANTEGVEEPASLNDGQVRLAIQSPESFELLKLNGQATTPIATEYTVALNQSPYVLSIDPQAIQVKKETRIFNVIASDFEVVEKDSLAKAISFSNWNVDKAQNQLKFNLNLDPLKFETSGIHLVTADVVARQLQEPDWWKEWNWNPEQDRATDGSKTRNLQRFLGLLKEQTEGLMSEEETSAQIGRFCYAIDKT